ncbi:MAG TPA: ABC transporter ATP-binding protein [Candidatus Lokiarchaeia archaeon]|nr:ABC transporter ATP-binding protein [Candidatus Lokiarchaeia archaeon]
MGGGPMAVLGGRGGPKVSDFSGTFRKLFNYMGRYKVAVFFAFIFSAISTAANIFGPKILGNATTDLFNGIMAKIQGKGDIDFGKIASILLYALSLYMLSAVFSYFSGYLMARVSTNVAYRMRRDISIKFNHLPLKYFDDTTQGEVLSRVANDVDTINQNLSQSLTQIISSITTIIGVVWMMFTISLELTLVALITIPISFFCIGLIIKLSQKYFKAQQDNLGHVNGHVEEMYGGHTIMKVFNGEEQSIRRFDRYNNQLYGAAWTSQFLSGLLMPIINVIGNISYVLIAVLGGTLAINGTIGVGDIQAFIQYVRSVTQPISQIANISNILQQTAAASERVFKFLEAHEEVPERTQPVKLDHVEGHVEFNHVRFGYNPDKIIIDDFSAVALPGQKVAIVGPTGSGKTTIVKLLMRFYDIEDGEILIDGNDIRDFTRYDLRHMFGMVLQDTWLFNGTIMENIRYGRPDATDEEVIEAAKAAYVDHFVRTLPDGYNMVLNEEASNVSQGQKQLLTIARAILANPSILILDEATSSVDTRTELQIQAAMDLLMQHRTSFVIAHRLSTIRNADLILVIRNGDIIEQGTHDELMALGGFYYTLHHSQFETMDEFSAHIDEIIAKRDEKR